MGTVGLSFGSPTSGAGFDVSSTVAEIVGNLENVETPWKNQLTSLESQNAAISSLGTLFSNLSTDIGNLTDFQGILAEKEGSSSDENVLTLTAATSSAVAGTHTVTVSNLAQTSSGYLQALPNANDTLSGSITLQVGSGPPQTISLTSSDNTLAGLAEAINSSGLGVTASVLTDAGGSRLSLVSGTSGSGGDLSIGGNSLTAAAPNTLAYTGTAGTTGANSTGTFSPVSSPNEALSGSMTVAVGSGSAASISMSAVSSAEGGATLGDLAAYINSNATALGVTAAIETNADGTSSLSLTSSTAGSAGTLTVNSSLVDSVTALGYTSAVAGEDANLTVDGVALTSASNTVANLIPGVTFQLLAPSAESGGSLEPVQVVISNDNTAVESTVNQYVSDYNSLISAINAQEGNTSSGTPEPLYGSPTLSLLQQQLLSSLNTANPNGSLTPLAVNPNTTLSGSISIQVGSGSPQTVTVGQNSNTLAGLAAAINQANLGATATVATSGGQATLLLTSQTAGTSGALSVTSHIAASTPAAVNYSDTGGYTSSTADNGILGPIAGASDTLSGSLSIQVGSGPAQKIALNSSDNTLSGLASAINNANIGVTASVNASETGGNPAGTVLTLTSGTIGAAGAMAVTSQIVDNTNATATPLAYTNSSDINSITGLGISVNNDGSLTFDATTLDSVLNADYSGVVGFFQNANGWGQTVSAMLSNAGSSSASGILALASSSNSSIESTLNADISREQSLISAQQSSLTAELNSANEIMQQLPSQLEGVNELYSAITGYNENQGG